ncbi:MAG TPA: gamma-glutamyltransferase [bacterium]|nr:gamma-glutamyltransferase [bacterium]HPR89600.1 gamma-glutamyltransferase [bacterium]
MAGALGLLLTVACSRPAPAPLTNRAAGRMGIVASGNEQATRAGLRVLEQGGNAADAAVATLLALSVKTIGAFCIGGEVPLIYYEAASGKVTVLNGQGGAPLDSAAIAWYYRNGIPGGGIKSAAVPAVVDLCVTTLQHFGSRKFAQVAAPTLELLDAGGPAWYRDTSDGDTIRTARNWYADLAVTLRKLAAAERGTRGSRAQKLQAVSDRFYRGDIAGDLESWYIQEGGFLRRADLAAHVTRIEAPVTLHYKGYTICKCGPWTQGPWVLQALRLLEGYDLKRMGHNSAEYIHTVAEAMKLALADRDQYYGDPAFVEVPLAQLLSDSYTALRRPLIDPARASLDLRPGDPFAMRALRPGGGRFFPAGGGTTICAVADRWGNVAVCTPSGLGSRAGTGGVTGVTHGTRLVILNTWPDHPNRIEPGKRPRTTLTPTLVLRDGRPFLAISVAGGDMQDQAALQILLNVIEFGMEADAAWSARRFSTNHFIGSFGQDPPRLADLHLPDTMPAAEVADLERRGHRVTLTRENPGGVAMLQWDPAGGPVAAAGGRSGALE